MTYELLRIFYALWMGGILLLSLNALSTIIFAKKLKGKDWKVILTLPLFLAVWPLAIFSPNGRKVLLVRFNQL